jgi:hypothetical protein
MRIIILALLILAVLTGTACLQKTQTDTTTAVISVPLLPDPGSQPAPYSIYLLPVSTDQQGALVPGEAIRLTGEGETYIHPHWSPDGRTILFISIR